MSTVGRQAANNLAREISKQNAINQDKADYANANILLSQSKKIGGVIKDIEESGVLPKDAGVDINYLGSNVVSQAPTRVIVALIGLIFALILFYFAAFTGLFKSYNTLQKDEIKSAVDTAKTTYPEFATFYDNLDDYYATSIAGTIVVAITGLILIGLLIYYSQRKFISEDYDVLEKTIVQLEAERAYKRARQPIKTASQMLARRFLDNNVSQSLDIASDAGRISAGKNPRKYGPGEDYSNIADAGELTGLGARTLADYQGRIAEAEEKASSADQRVQAAQQQARSEIAENRRNAVRQNLQANQKIQTAREAQEAAQKQIQTAREAQTEANQRAAAAEAAAERRAQNAEAEARRRAQNAETEAQRRAAADYSNRNIALADAQAETQKQQRLYNEARDVIRTLPTTTPSQRTRIEQTDQRLQKQLRQLDESGGALEGRSDEDLQRQIEDLQRRIQGLREEEGEGEGRTTVLSPLRIPYY